MSTEFSVKPRHYCGMTEINESNIYVVVVCSGLMLLSTIFQSYHDSVWLQQGTQRSLL